MGHVDDLQLKDADIRRRVVFVPGLMQQAVPKAAPQSHEYR